MKLSKKKKRRKNKILLFTVMVMSLVVGIASSFVFSLAYFGENMSGSDILKFQNGIYLDTSVTEQYDIGYGFPAEIKTVTGQAKVITDGTGVVTNAFVRTTFNISFMDKVYTNDNSTTQLITSIVVDGETVFWKLDPTDGYYYLVTTHDGDQLYEVEPTHEGKELNFTIKFTIPNQFENVLEGNTFIFECTFSAIQNKIWGDQDEPLAPTIDNYRDVFNEVEGYTPDEMI